MKKLILVANVSKEHIRKFYIPFIQLMQAKDWQVDVACRMDVPVPECDNAYDLPCDRNPFRGGLLESVKQLKKILRENDYDVVVCSTVVGAMVARLAADTFRKKGLKVIYLCHGLHFFPGAPLTRWILGYPVEKFLAHKTDAMVVINDTDKDTARKYLKIPITEKCHSMGVDFSCFRSAALLDEERNRQRKSLGIYPNDCVLTYVAEINDNKNQKMLLDAFAYIQKAVPRAKLLLIGPEHDGGALRNYVTESGLQEDILLLGWRNDIPDLLQISDVYVASSKSEGLGLNLIEAMACGLPVVATKNRGHEEIVVHGQNGFLVNQNDSEDMAAYILQLYENEELRKMITKKAQNDIEKFGTEAAIRELVEMIEHHV